MPETIGKVWRWEIHSCSCEYKLNTIDTFAFDIIRTMSQPEADSEPSSVSNRNTVVAAAAVVTFVVVADDCRRSWCASARRAGAAGDPCSSAR